MHPALRIHGIESYLAVPLLRRDGSYFGTLCTFDPEPRDVSDADLEIFGLLAELIAFELEAEERQERYQAEMQALEDLLAVAAHDLRTPMTVLYGRIQLLARQARRGLSASELLSGLDALQAQARRTVDLSELLLDMTRIETGTFQLNMREFDLVAAAQQAVSDFQDLAPRHSFSFEAPPLLRLTGDEHRIGQVLRNLLDNAVKYTAAERGPILVRLQQIAVAGGAPTAVLRVEDHGCGVADAELPQLFNRGYRASSNAPGVPGSGMGLYACRQIIQAHGGAIQAEHVPGGGLAVSFTLPAH